MRIERNHTRNVVLTGMMAAIIAVVSLNHHTNAQWSAINHRCFAVALSGAVPGWKRALFGFGLCVCSRQWGPLFLLGLKEAPRRSV